MCVGRTEKQPVFVHGHATLPDVIPIRLPLKVPDLAAGSCISRPNVIGNGEVEDAVYLERRRFESLLMGLESPRQSQRSDIPLIDLR